MNDSDLKFDPQVMALAMPGESGFTKGAEGILNLGKVFQGEEDRQSTNALNALKMEEANQSIIGKKNENSIFGEKQEREQTNYLLEKRKKLADAIKSESEGKSEIKKIEESGLMEKLKGVLPNSAFFQNNKIDKETFDNTRAAFLEAPEWKDKGHIVNALFDSKYKEMIEAQEAVLKNSKTAAEADKIAEEAKTIVPKSDAYIASQKSVVTKNNAGAHLDNVRADQVPKETQIKRDKEERLNRGGTKDDPNSPKTWEQNIAMGRMKNLVSGYDDLTPSQKLEVDQRYRSTGKLPSNVRPFTDEESDTYGDGTHRAVYTVNKPKAEVTSSGYEEGTIIKNGQGVKMVMKNGQWVKQ